MKKMNLLAVVGAAACLTLLSGCKKDATPSGPPVDMKLKWTVGKRYDQAITMTQNTKSTAPGVNETIENNMNMVEELSVTAAKARPTGGTELEMNFTGIKMDQKMAGQSLKFDSHSDPNGDGSNPVAPMLRKMVGAHVKYLTDAGGKVEQVVGYQEFIDQIASGNAQVGAMVKGMFSEDTLKQMGVSGQGLPTKPVQVGESWPYHQEIAVGPIGTMVVDMNITFKGWEDHDGHHCAILESTGQMKNRPDNSAGGMKLEIEKGTTKGTMWFDPDLGMMVDNVIDQVMTMKMQIQGQNVSSKLNQRIKVALVKVADAGK